MVAAGWHSWLAIALVALLHVALVGKSLLRVHGHVGHVASGHVRVLGHAWSAAALRGNVLAGGLLRGVDLVGAINAVLVAGRWLGRIQACL